MKYLAFQPNNKQLIYQIFHNLIIYDKQSCMNFPNFNQINQKLFLLSERQIGKTIQQKSLRIKELEDRILELQVENRQLRNSQFISFEKKNKFRSFTEAQYGQQFSFESSKQYQQFLQEKFMKAARVKAWSELERLQILTISGRGLKQLPAKLCTIQLKFLSLYNNDLCRIPENIGTMSKLKILVICRNPQLKSLPISFKNLNQLKQLYLDSQLLPKSQILSTQPFSSLKKLQKVQIYKSLNDEIDTQRRQQIEKQFNAKNIKVVFIS